MFHRVYNSYNAVDKGLPEKPCCTCLKSNGSLMFNLFKFELLVLFCLVRGELL